VDRFRLNVTQRRGHYVFWWDWTVDQKRKIGTEYRARAQKKKKGPLLPLREKGDRGGKSKISRARKRVEFIAKASELFKTGVEEEEGSRSTLKGKWSRGKNRKGTIKAH